MSLSSRTVTTSRMAERPPSSCMKSIPLAVALMLTWCESSSKYGESRTCSNPSSSKYRISWMILMATWSFIPLAQSTQSGYAFMAAVSICRCLWRSYFFMVISCVIGMLMERNQHFGTSRYDRPIAEGGV